MGEAEQSREKQKRAPDRCNNQNTITCSSCCSSETQELANPAYFCGLQTTPTRKATSVPLEWILKFAQSNLREKPSSFRFGIQLGRRGSAPSPAATIAEHTALS